MMLETRACYGYYGEGHGASGETPPKTHASGWSIYTFQFDIKPLEGRYHSFKCIEIRAKSYKNALKQAKQWGKKDGFEIVGDSKGWEIQRTFGMESEER